MIKFKIKAVLTTVAVACSFFAAGSLKADITTTNIISISATALAQGNTNVSSGIGTIANPKSYSVTTKQILAWLAQDEYAESNYTATNFPSGAQLVVLLNTNGPDFQVLNKTNAFLVDVSDILSSEHGSNEVHYGKFKVATGVYLPSITSKRTATFRFDDTGVVAVQGSVAGVGLYIHGLETRVFTDSLPNSSGKYTEIIDSTVNNGAGEGTYKGIPVVVTGSFEYSTTLQLDDR